MSSNNKYDTIGELFHRKLEPHRIPTDSNDWDEIERRLDTDESSKKSVIWLWLSGVAAAVVAALFIFNQPTIDEAAVMMTSQQITLDETKTTNDEVVSIVARQEMAHSTPIDIVNHSVLQKQNTDSNTDAAISNTQKESDVTENPVIGVTSQIAEIEKHQEMPTDEYRQLEAALEKEIQKLDMLFTEDKLAVKKEKSWLLAAAFGTTGSRSDGFDNNTVNNTPLYQQKPIGTKSAGNQYASEMSNNIRSFDYMLRQDFKNIQHLPPLSFGIMARKNIGNQAGIESGLIYTYLASHFEWEGHDVRQNLHYVGIPVNMAIYLWNSNPNWKIYCSAGFTVEKGLRAIYTQERQWSNESSITTVKSSIDGLQWSLNGALGVNYRLEKGWGIHLEPRVGYGFECNQPISMRTEWPVYVGFNFGLNYEL